MSKGRVAVFLSGRGSNFEAIYRSSLKEDSNFQIVTVISDRSGAAGYRKALDYKLNAYHVSLKSCGSKKAYEARILQYLNRHRVELICLAGYMKIVGTVLLEAFPRRIINIHPALLPSFPGLDAQSQACEYGVKVSGCTVHFVDSGVDTGPVILQRTVIVDDADTGDTLSDKILKEEHLAYSEAIRLYFGNRLKIVGRKVIIK